jgi:hypothetical protein
MATDAQTEANRRNSLRSTGPRTQAGKSASSQNAVRGGLYARSLLIPGEDPVELEALARDYFESCNPQTPTEAALVAQLLRSEWLIRRMTTVESQLWSFHDQGNRKYAERRGEDLDEPHLLALAYFDFDNRLVLIQRRISSLERAYHRALTDLDRLQSARGQTNLSQGAAVAPRGQIRLSPSAPRNQIGFVPSNPTPTAVNPPILGHFPQPKSSGNTTISPLHREIAQIPANRTFRPFGPLRAYTLAVPRMRKGTL